MLGDMLRLFLYPGRLVYVGPGVDADEHAHHAFQLTVRVAGDVSFDVGAGLVPSAVTLIPPDRPHAQRASGAVIASVYVDPESTEGRALVGAGAGQRLVTPDLDLAAVMKWRADEAWRWSSALIESVAGGVTAPSPVDGRVARALAYLRDHVDDGDVSLAAVARAAGLSTSRVSHLFTAQVGVPIRPYVLWLRLQRAAETLAEGLNLTEAAHAAGFADAAHLSRTFRRMFGIPPSAVAASALVVSRQR